MTSCTDSQRSSIKSSRRSTPANNVPTVDELYEMGNALPFKLVFVDLQQVVCNALRSRFPSDALSSEIAVIRGKFEEHLESNSIDCIVSTSNAFGLMDHGFDRSVCKVLSGENDKIETRMQKQILDRYHGEQPIGTCIIIETANPNTKYFAHAPTRRINYSIKGTDNIYLAMKAICNEVRIWNEGNSEDNQIRNVLLTGLGTFYGAVSPDESARQTVLGWLLSRLPKPSISDINWDYAKLRQSLIGYGGFNHFFQYVDKHGGSLTKQQQRILANNLPKQIIEGVYNEYTHQVEQKHDDGDFSSKSEVRRKKK
eukprot:5203_1